MSTITRDFLNHLYWERWLSTHQIAKMVRKSQTTVRKMMLRMGIQLRNNRDRLRVKITPEMLRTLYWDKRMTISQIANALGVSGWTIHQRMIKFNIPRQKVGEACLKQQKLPFSGDPIEMSYLLGLRAGDLAAKWKGKRVRVEVCTSHPAMLELFRNSFNKYGHIGMCPEYKKPLRVFMWRAFADLDASFSFLIEKLESIEEDILSNEDMFLAFLAGYADAEGSIIVRPSSDRILFYFRICSEDFGLLRDIYKKLCEMGYRPRLALDKKKGTDSGFSKLKNDYWRLELCRKDDVIMFIQQLPTKHSEKIRKKNLALEIRNQIRWLKVRDDILSLKAEIKREVKECVQRAALVYHKKHTP